MLRSWRPAIAKARLRRFLRDGAGRAELRKWLPGIAATGLISTGAVLLAASQTERFKNELLQAFAIEKMAQIARDLTAETNDWAVWDETHNYLLGSNPHYFAVNYNGFSFARSPFVATLNTAGHLVSTATFDPDSQSVRRLKPEAEAELMRLIPGGDPLRSLTFLARFQGEPYLMSAQPVYATDQTGAASGRLLFVRPLAQPDSLNKALGILKQQFLPPGQNAAGSAWHLLPPLQVRVNLSPWAGRQPLEQVILRRPSERAAALLGITGLGMGAGLLVGAIGIRSTIRHRAERYLTLRHQQERRRLDRDLNYRRSHDALTGLANETGLLDAIANQRKTYPSFLQAVLVADLDHFSVVNSGLGRSAGDAVLQAFGRHLQAVSHPSSCIGRLGADQYACSLVSTGEAALRSEVAELSQAINNLAVAVEGHTVNLTASIGAATIRDGDAGRALHQASIACSLVQLAGGRSHQFFGDERASTSSYLEMQRMNEALVAAIRDNRIELHGQHAWLLDDHGQLPSVYVELLARIREPDGNNAYWSEPMIEAARFCGSLTLLDEHILSLAFQEIAAIQHDETLQLQARPLTFAINITADTLLSPDLPEQLNALLEKNALTAANICLELTEQAALRDPQAAIVRMNQLRRLGFKLSLDDFGTGTTSLGYLRDLPLDYVKIDKRFIWTLQDETTSRLIVQFVVELGREIGFQTIAEGVEDMPLLLILQAMGVNIAQGYLITQPRPLSGREPHWPFADSGDSLLIARR